jgi:excinuclease ABC subunit C
MESMKNDLRLESEPRHIECFDNSNIQGTNAVAAMVVFRDGKPEKKEYRHFNIKTVEGPDDFASMQEVIYRRYKRMLDQEEALPQLIIVDGGKGQLSSAVISLEKLGILDKVKIIGIAKRLEELYYPGDSLPLYLDKKSVTLKVIQHARDEAHRFGISHHRKKRSKTMTKSVLSDIDGVGFSTAQKLLWKFKSVKNLSAAPLDEIAQVVGKAKAGAIFAFFHPPETEQS